MPRFHGLFDDDMSVALSTGISFYNIDASFDYIFSLGMSPLVELSFTPTLYKTTNGTIFNYQANISPPKLANWTNLISLFAQHLLERYGSGVVHSLFFEVWNEYNCGFLVCCCLMLSCFVFLLLKKDSQTPEESYFELYKATFQALKSMDPKLAVGGPVTCMGLIDPFISYLAEHPEVSVDFISTHVYPTDPNVTDGEIRFLINNTVKTVEMSKLSVPVFFTEFNDGLFNNPPMHDFPYAASYFVKQMSRIDATLPLGGVPLMSWWTFTDVFEEDGMPAQEFDKPTSTGWGLLSSSGIEKPVYRAFQLLHQAGNTRHAVTAQGSIHPDSELLVSDFQFQLFLMSFLFQGGFGRFWIHDDLCGE